MASNKINKNFCRISLVMYLVYYNYSSAGPECQAKRAPAAIFTGTFVKTLFDSAATANWTQMALIYTIKKLSTSGLCRLSF